jgi:hypothetical protein
VYPESAATPERTGNSESGGQGEIRTRDLYNANVAIFQLIYLPDVASDYLFLLKVYAEPS